MLAAATAACESDPCGRWEHALYITSLLRAESRMLERGATASNGPRAAGAMELATSGGLLLALRAMMQRSSSTDYRNGNCHSTPRTVETRSRLAAAGAATLAHLAAACGENKRAVLEAGGVVVLVSCLLVASATLTTVDCSGVSGDGDGTAADAATELSVQCCRLLGNLTYGWGQTVHDVKAAVKAADGPSALVQLLAATTTGSHGSTAKRELGRQRQILRWAAHALRNLGVDSKPMQHSCGVAGAIEALARSTASIQSRQRTPMHAGQGPELNLAAAQWLQAQLQGCKAIAYLAKGHEPNSARAAAAGCLELGLRLLAQVARALPPSTHALQQKTEGPRQQGQQGQQEAQEEPQRVSIPVRLVAEVAEAGCRVLTFVVSGGSASSSSSPLSSAEGATEATMAAAGGRATLAVQGGAIDALAQLAWRAHWPQQPQMGQMQDQDAAREVIVRWAAQALTAIIVHCAAASRPDSQHSTAQGLLWAALKTSHARAAVASHTASSCKRKKTREAVTSCLAAIDGCLEQQRQCSRQPEPTRESSSPGPLPTTVALAVDNHGDLTTRPRQDRSQGEQEGAHSPAWVYSFIAGIESELTAAPQSRTSSRKARTPTARTPCSDHHHQQQQQQQQQSKSPAEGPAAAVQQGRAASRGFRYLRQDLAALPWLVTTAATDIVLAPPMRPAFRAHLEAELARAAEADAARPRDERRRMRMQAAVEEEACTGDVDGGDSGNGRLQLKVLPPVLPEFHEAVPAGRKVAGYRPYVPSIVHACALFRSYRNHCLLMRCCSR